MYERLTCAGFCLVASCGTAIAGGLDRTGQSIGILFENGGASGGYLQVDLFRAYPDVTGTGAGIAGFLAPGGSYANVADMFDGIGGALKFQINDKLSAAFIAEQPYGSDLLYPGSGLATELGGTLAWAETSSLTALLRYKIDENWSVHGGLRYQEIEGDIRLSGWAYGPPKVMGLPSANGYEVSLGKDSAWGYVLGASYEIPEIAFRATLTYNSEITHKMDTEESGNPSPALDGRSVTEVKTPRSVNLDLQTGIAPDTLLYGSVRWAEWSAFRIDPVGFVHPMEEGGGGVGLVELDDTVTYTVGLARRFSEKWSGSAEIFYEPREDGVVAPLFPSVGFWGAGVAVRRDWENFNLSLGARYTRLGDGRVETLPAGTARANFEENDILSLGLRVGYKF
ncbi:OmpP1/FadL family transporter [Aliiruegeria sabulilitoris]|uniref:OmpP1/FadL family transporter n=1 Tax=Aliiruegeria sabulilitoris TaxID=1510458 RepID=UPI00082A88EE|nr:outer membrane protein transport protein [Aliiruegeria sabulilitoris]NDR55765.1 aromatic hydrocarbon degradation protein [Pseudoruegeria sp. M32A2M]